eukprot:COSAG04_NODE_3285_length_2973_cov_3.607168_5_plen_93_part_01
MSPTTASDFAAQLADKHGPCWRYINVKVGRRGEKTPRGERNNLTPAQIAEDRGKGNTVSIYLKHCPGLYSARTARRAAAAQALGGTGARAGPR